MDVLEAILGGVIGVEAATLMNDFIRKHGGVQGLVAEWEKAGADLGEKVKSWISTGPNQPISMEQIRQAIGPDRLNDLATKLHTTSDKLAELLSKHLPTAIDEATPEGKPEEAEKTVPIHQG
ncbi:YidB family protein [Methylocystis heyeri]|uniref:DUF937 domain-containing protein n=1 Tax=Methylocystis heyeri TaxID=391905 RepID=A0A6B8K9D0_9HYPH|nr:YidB family protein [Methylocystis heyeri]QGM44317.1 hypothetical protein H2LOC_000590 [Methylocystis heyeri]